MKTRLIYTLLVAIIFVITGPFFAGFEEACSEEITSRKVTLTTEAYSPDKPGGVQSTASQKNLDDFALSEIINQILEEKEEIDN